MKYKIVPVTPFQQNCTVMWCEKTLKAVVVDPGGDVHKIVNLLETEKLILEKILLTHAHIDHAGGTAELAILKNVPIEGPHKDDQFWIEGLDQQSAMFGFPKVSNFVPNRWLNDGDQIRFGEVVLEVLHCPGHTPGHVIFYNADEKLAQVGDVIFQGSIGRTDFPRGNHQDLIRSIKEKLFVLGDDIRFIPGHGPMSTLGAERKHNPFVADHRG
ncbi:MBL fold metallo-hydrolase [Nitrincola nitratireducens]|uniref:Metallo-beta-lactamase domain-containing protein n=1 Tax=Nitrincola nitratireducens TaxID=1229521 RepID=W9VF08_9GAMM|nr:MBL fold metallo-hydrolase [Nitrincola nitratireducens]EXJ09265.1 hypothetical protein D791_03838 [Nitrincola nitratireducens]